MKIIYKILLLSLFSFSTNLSGQNNADYELRLNNLEKKNRVLQEQIFKLEHQKLESENIKYKADFIVFSYKHALDREETFINRMISLIAALPIIGGILAWFGFSSFKKTKKELTERVKNDIAKEMQGVKEKSLETITTLIENEKWRSDLIHRSHIMYYNPIKRSDDKYMQTVLDEFNSIEILKDKTNPTIRELIGEVEENMNLNKLNILLLENTDGEYNVDKEEHQKHLVELIHGLPQHVFIFYVGQGHFPSEIKVFTDNKISKHKAKSLINKVGFARKASTTFNNVIETLKFMSIIQKQ